MRKSVTSSLRAMKPTSPKALDILRTAAAVKATYSGKRRFDLEQLNPATIVELLDAVAAANAGVLFGFNRSGTFNLLLFLEGDKETFIIENEEAFIKTTATIYDALWSYAADKFPDVALEIEAQETPLEGTSA